LDSGSQAQYFADLSIGWDPTSGFQGEMVLQSGFLTKDKEEKIENDKKTLDLFYYWYKLKVF